MFGRNHRGQFFSFDVIAGAFIFLIAFFLLAFYWLNAQALFAQQEQGDMQREAERVADQLLVPSDISVGLIAEYTMLPAPVPPSYKLDDVHETPVLSIGNGRAGINLLAMTHLIYASNMSKEKDRLDKGRFYADAGEKLGIPKYEYYVTIEDDDGAILGSCNDFLKLDGPDGRMKCAAGTAPAGAREVANAERIVLFTDDLTGKPELRKLRMQVWQ